MEGIADRVSCRGIPRIKFERLAGKQIVIPNPNESQKEEQNDQKLSQGVVFHNDQCCANGRLLR